MMTQERQILANYIESCITRAPSGVSFTLASGKTSNFYIDLRRAVLMDSHALALAVSELYDVLPDEVESIGGVPTAGLILMGGLMLQCHEYDLNLTRPRTGFYTREAAKAHGTNRQVEGNPKGIACMVEDTVTTGMSLIQHIQIARAHGVDVRYALALFDRNEGGREALHAMGVELHAVFTAKDFAL